MPLDENPYFRPVMESIDMIAAENARIQAEERAFQRQTEFEDIRFQRQEEQRQRMAGEQEYGELTKAIQMYPQTIQAGGEPDPELLKSMVERRNALIQEGVTPRMQAQVPGVPAPAKPEEGVPLDPKVADFYKYDPNARVKPETKRILHKAYRDYFKPKDKGDGKTDKETDALGLIAKYRENMRTRITSGLKEKGDIENLGIAQDISNEYLGELQKIEQDLRAGLISKAEAIQQLVALGTPEQFLYSEGAQGDQADEKMDTIEEALLKMVED